MDMRISFDEEFIEILKTKKMKKKRMFALRNVDFQGEDFLEKFKINTQLIVVYVDRRFEKGL